MKNTKQTNNTRHSELQGELNFIQERDYLGVISESSKLDAEINSAGHETINTSDSKVIHKSSPMDCHEVFQTSRNDEKMDCHEVFQTSSNDEKSTSVISNKVRNLFKIISSLFSLNPKNQKIQTNTSNSINYKLLATSLSKTYGFTLVELIVVITILAILGTIAFVSFGSYSSNSRDSARVADINNLKKSFELYNTVGGAGYPMPDSYTGITYSGGTIWYQGVFGDTTFRVVNKNLSKKIVDPLNGKEYTYSLTASKKEYQLKADFENKLSYDLADSQKLVASSIDGKGEIESKGFSLNDILKIPFFKGMTNNFFNTSFADSSSTGSVCYINGSYNGLITKVNDGEKDLLITVPSLIISDISNPANTTFTGGSISKMGSGILQCNGTNSPCNITYNAQVVWSGTLSKDDYPSLLTNIKNSYSGSNITTLPVIQNILTLTGTTSIENSVGGLVKGVGSVVKEGSNDDSVPQVSQWKDIAGNEACTNNDYVFSYSGVLNGNILKEYRWAGCNSYRGDSGITTNGEVYNGTCYNYTSGTMPCTNMNPTDKEISYSATYGEDNIWGKLYLWTKAVQSNNACPTGWHLSSDNEWEILETYLNSLGNNYPRSNCRNATDGRLCSGLGWSVKSSKNSNNNIIKALKLPLAGYWNNGFHVRASDLYVWTSSEYDGTYARGRTTDWSISTIRRQMRDKFVTGFSVRCLKDN